MGIEMSKTRSISMQTRWRRREEIGKNHFKQKETIFQAQVPYVHWKKSRNRFRRLG